MKGFLKGSSKNRAQQTPEISQPYPTQNILSPSDPRINPPLQYQNQRTDHTQPIAQSQEQFSTAVGRSPSQRRISSFQNSELRSATGGFNPAQQLGQEDLQHSHVDEYRQSTNKTGDLSGQTSQDFTEEKERRGFRDRLGLKHSKDGGREQTASNFGRRLSVRGKTSPNPDRYSDSEGRGHFWSKQSNSSQVLLSPTDEGEEAQHNRFANPQGLTRPPVPLKDEQHAQAFAQQHGQQEYYPSPGSQQILSGAAHRSRLSSEQVNLPPEQQQQQQIQLQRQQQQEAGQYNQYEKQQHQTSQDQGQGRQYQQRPPPENVSDQLQGHPTAPPPSYTIAVTDERINEQQIQQHSTEDVPNQYPPQIQAQSSEIDRQQPLKFHQPQVNRRPPGNQDDLYLQAHQVSQQAHGATSPVQPQTAEQHFPVLQQPPSLNELQQTAPSPMPNPTRSGPGATRPADSKGTQGQQPYRGPPPPQDGRSTPAASEKMVTDMTVEEIEHYHQLMRDHKELKDKYQKVKKYYFDRDAQVQELQNTIANQRLSASRTSLDDSEYMARFNRLDGLISQLAFSIRKSWTSVPEWLQPAINKDAISTGKQEMTAVGRAFISWWLYSEVFERIFHPDLEINLSLALKGILTNLRRFAPPCNSEVEEQNLSSKLVSWRMTTIEGIQDQLRAPASQQHRADLLQHLNAQLIGDISAYLTDPAPQDLAGGVYMIVELAANIISHLPLESREVTIEYYPPMCPILENVMKIEQGIPQLSSPILGNGSDDNDNDSTKETAASTETTKEDDQAPPQPPHKEDIAPKGRRGMLANLMGAASGKQPAAGQTASQQPNTGVQTAAGKAGPPGTMAAAGVAGKSNGRDASGQGSKEERVRLSVGLGVGIRNRSVLVKAPVYTTIV